MNSPKQARPKSTPKPVSGSLSTGMARGRVTPATKTRPKLCNCPPRG